MRNPFQRLVTNLASARELSEEDLRLVSGGEGGDGGDGGGGSDGSDGSDSDSDSDSSSDTSSADISGMNNCDNGCCTDAVSGEGQCDT
jgi:hypothetical protein